MKEGLPGKLYENINSLYAAASKNPSVFLDFLDGCSCLLYRK